VRLTWLQLRPPANATVTVNDVVVRMPPAAAIMSMPRMALEDPAQTPAAFRWTEGAALVMNAMQQPGNYAISLASCPRRGHRIFVMLVVIGRHLNPPH
jgi:hypothetical protein